MYIHYQRQQILFILTNFVMGIKDRFIFILSGIIVNFKMPFFFFLIINLSACANTTAFKPPNVLHIKKGEIVFHAVTINKAKSKLFTYSAINGRLNSRPDDYIKIAQKNTVSFFAHKNHVKEAEEILGSPCCHDKKSVSKNIAKIIEWVHNLFNSDIDLQVEVFLVPDDYSYKYVTKNKIKNKKTKARFAFHYFSNSQIANTKYVEYVSSTLAHELAHIYTGLSDMRAKNDISSETTAKIVGVCARTIIAKTLPDKISGMAFVTKDGEEIMPKARNTEYDEIINRLKKNPPVITANIIAQLLVEKIDKKYRSSQQLKTQKMLEYCQQIVRNRHDFTRSIGID